MAEILSFQSQEYSPNGTVLVEYVYGHDLIAQVQGNNRTFYHVDGLGSTRVLTDAHGSVVSTYNYEAYGELINSTGGVENKYLFAGEQYDETLGDYYNRARYYDTDTGRFTRRDDYEGRLGEPLTLHKYIYAHDNPVNGIDPSGYLTMLDVMGTFALIGVLASIPALARIHVDSANSSTANQTLQDDVIIYVGYASTYEFAGIQLGHVAIEIDGKIYDFPGSAEETDDRDANNWLKYQKDVHKYSIFNRYSINYNDKQKEMLKANLQRALTTQYANSGDYNAFFFNCSSFVREVLPNRPNNDWRFDAMIKWLPTNAVPISLDDNLTTMNTLSSQRTVKRLGKTYISPPQNNNRV